jgi:hypothetical protein
MRTCGPGQPPPPPQQQGPVIAADCQTLSNNALIPKCCRQAQA